MRAKGSAARPPGALPWYDLFAPLPFARARFVVRRVELIRGAFARTASRWADSSMRSRRTVDRCRPREGKRGGAFCMPFVDDRSLVF
jgi:oligoendopeptidase F